jgi:Zn-dependent protease
MAIVAAAGPLANLLMAVFWVLLAKLGVLIGTEQGSVAMFLIYSGIAGMFINIVLMVINLIPLPPLDGGRVLVGLLPGPLAWKVSRVEPYGMIILVVLLVTRVLGYIVSPPIIFTLSAFAVIAGLNERGLTLVLRALGVF